MLSELIKYLESIRTAWGDVPVYYHSDSYGEKESLDPHEAFNVKYNLAGHVCEVVHNER